MTTSKLPFVKYTALGNDYIVLEEEYGLSLSSEQISRVCDRRFGLGADGVLVSDMKERFVTIFNSDGSRAKKSGNGLRIFAYHLIRQGVVSNGSFSVHCEAGSHAVYSDEASIDINMGDLEKVFNPVSKTWSCDVENSDFSILEIYIGSKQFKCVPIDIGNPHCVVLDAQASDLYDYGELIENHDLFPGKVNVQFVQHASDVDLEILIWERGSGHTLSSGSSSTAAFIVANKLGLCGNEVAVQMEGGRLLLRRAGDGVWMRGPVSPVAEGVILLQSSF